MPQFRGKNLSEERVDRVMESRHVKQKDKPTFESGNCVCTYDYERAARIKDAPVAKLHPELTRIIDKSKESHLIVRREHVRSADGKKLELVHYQAHLPNGELLWKKKLD